MIGGISVGVVVVVVAVVVAIGLSGGGTSGAPRTTLAPSIEAHLTSVPLSTLVAGAATGTQLQPAVALNGTPLSATSKPEILYIGAEFCSICATERWVMVAALSHFGTFSNLQQTHSAIRDGDIPTLSFYGSTFSSPYVTFTPVETTTNQPQGNYYKTLQTPTAAQQALWQAGMTKAGQAGLGFPFIDIGGKYELITSQFPATTLEGHSFTDIANSVGDNTNSIGAAISASAAALIKYICATTGQQPATTCKAVAGVNAPVGSSTGTSSSAP